MTFFLRFSLKVFLFLFVFFFLFTSCKKKGDTPLSGDYSDLLGGFNLSVSDTHRILGHTSRIDSVYSTNSGLKFLGSHQDAIFGRTDASIITNLSLPNEITQVSFGSNPYLVQAELVLTLASVDFVGNSATPMQYDVYLLQKSPEPNGSYSTNNYSFTSAVQLGTYTGTLVSLGDKQGIKIPMDASFVQSLLTNSIALASSTQLQQQLKGFFITTRNTNINPTSAPGFIAQFDLDHAYSGLIVHYKPDGNDPLKSTQTFTFTFKGTYSKRINQVDYDPFLSSDIQLQKQLQGDTALGSNYWFLKGMNGLRTRLYFPYLNNLRAFGPLLVSRAELTVYVDDVKNPGTTSPPPTLALFACDSLGRELYTADQLSSLDFARYGGDFDATESKYVFNIPREIQQILNGTRKNRGFWLVVANPDPLFAAQRDDNLRHLVLSGTASAKKPKLTLTLALPK